MFVVMPAKGTSDIDLLAKVQAELAKVREENAGVHMDMVFNTVDYTKQSYHSSIEALVEGALLAVLIVWFFLRDWRATLISALAIPLAAIPTFAFMNWMGFTLNSISLLALSLITGVLVDDAIVEIENITRHMAMGKSAWQASLDAADEIGLAVVATSFSIIAVFLPVSFISGIIGQYFREFGVTVAVAVFMSLLVARLISPLVAAYTLKPHAGLRTADGPLMEWYLRTLRWSVANRWKVILMGFVFLVLSLVGAAFVPQTFVPEADQDSSQANIELPPGVTLAQTSAASRQAYEILRRHKEVANIVESVGGDDEVRVGQIFVQLVPRSERNIKQKDWERKVEKELHAIPDARVTFQSQQDGNGRDITLFVVGSNPVLAEQTAHTLVEQMRTLKELREPRVNGDMPRPELVIHPRLDLAAQLGVTVAAISDTVRVATLGEIPQNAPKFSLADRQVPIRVGLVESARGNLSTIENMPVRTAAGATVPLKAVADISFGQGPAKVRRYNQNRRFSVEADQAQGVEQGTAMDKIKALPIYKHLPAGVQIIPKGNAEYQGELMTGFAIAMVSGILLVLAVLVLLFARLFQPITILFALPFSIGGALLALFVTNSPFSISTVLGFLMLMGIVAKNSILLVDFAIEEMRAGKDRLTALLEAGHKRARPIVMTSVAMIAGMLPVAIGLGGGDNSFQGQMAVAVIGGLITSTALTLIMVPPCFTLMDGVERWAARTLGRKSGGQPAEESAGGGSAGGALPQGASQSPRSTEV
jgi:multidrug efflux pump subunit AcrB